ncbi:MAG: GNAT family N-acetyltransferase [Clostridiales bacterium]|nr:GNAT family N-acetyltransferase [Clostridiales bacterium]
MKLLEEYSMNALPALQTVLYDGWVLRFAEGYTKRANSINPIYDSKIKLEKKLGICEQIFSSKNLKPVFKITPNSCPDYLDKALSEQNYQIIDETSVQTLALGSLSGSDLNETETKFNLEDEWLDLFSRLNSVNEKNKLIYNKMLKSIVPINYYSSLSTDGKKIACGRVVIENDFAGLFDITVDNDYRNRGYGTQLVKNMLCIAVNNGAKHAYLQVTTDNDSAYNLYNKLGFEEVYKYHYRGLN